MANLSDSPYGTCNTRATSRTDARAAIVPKVQILATRSDFADRQAYLSLRTVTENLLAAGVVPIFNENDVLSPEELDFSDNDQLAAEVAVVLQAEKLVILTDQDGIQANFGTENQYRLASIRVDEADQYITVTASAHGTGGASSKIQAARIALAGGVEVYIAKASESNSIEQALSGATGTKVVQ